MDAVSEKLLASAGLSGDEDAGICRAEFFGDLNFALHGLTDGNNIVKGIFGGETLADEAAPQLAPVLEGLGGGSGDNQRACGSAAACN